MPLYRHLEKTGGKMWRTVIFGLSILTIANATAADDSARQKEISAKAVELFKNTKNHCQSFQDLVAFAVTKTDGPGQLIEDLKFVLIGKSLNERGSGPFYIGNTPGARGDTGFKPELQDHSPQVEHAWAAIYIGKNFPPGSTEAAALLTEVMGPLLAGGKLNPQDTLLWALGGDTGQRLSNRNYKELPNVIKRIMCR
jgi:hypothetical protein